MPEFSIKLSYPGRIAEIFSSLALSLVVVSAVFAVIIFLLIGIFPHALEGTEQIAIAEAGRRIPNYFRNFLELVFFIANIILLITAVIALIVARAHAAEVEHARLAAIYMDISALWSSSRVVESRMHILKLRDRFHDPAYSDLLKDRARPAPEYIRLVLNAERSRDRMLHSQHTAILTFLEDIGVLCKKDYVKADDVLDFIASPITLQMELLEHYVLDLQATNPTAYENAVDLRGRAERFLQRRRP